MKKFKLNLLASSISVAVILASSQKVQGMDDKPEPRNISRAAHQNIDRAAHQNINVWRHWQNNPSSYHQIATEDYRFSTKTLNQEIGVLEQQINSLSCSSEKEVLLKTEMESLERKKKLLQDVLSQHASPEEAKEVVNKKIEEFEKTKKSYEGEILKNINLKDIYEPPLKTAEENLKVARNCLDALNNNITIDERIAAIRSYAEQSLVEHLKHTRSQKITTLKNLYQEHVKGVCDSDIFPQKLPTVILEGLGIASVQLDNVEEERLFRLFARTLELPYFYLKTEEDKEKAYLERLRAIDQNLTYRLQEDVCAFKENENIAKKQFIPIDLTAQSEKAKRFFKPNLSKKMIDRPQDAQNLREILSRYGYVMEEAFWRPVSTIPDLPSIILNQSPYGLLGLCVASLESYPTSWSPAGQVAAYARSSTNPTEIASNVTENIFLILARHINKQVLQRIEKTLMESSVPVPDPRQNPNKDKWVG